MCCLGISESDIVCYLGEVEDDDDRGDGTLPVQDDDLKAESHDMRV